MEFKQIFEPDPMLKKILPAVKAKPGVKYIPSLYTLPFAYGEKHYVSNLLTKECVEAVLPDAAQAGEGYDPLIESMFLVPEDKDECAFYMSIAAIVRAFEKQKGVRAFTIMPTLGCNARCIYCYEEGMKQVTMTPEIVEQTIRYILDNRHGDSVHLAWFGGEPLLCPDTIDRVCAGMRDAGVKYYSSMISNGSLITPEIVEKMSGDWHLKKIQVSMDGAEEDYRARKKYYTYRDYYHGVMDAISRMSQAGIHVTIRCNIDEENWERIPQYIEDLKNGVANKDLVRLYFAPLNSVRLGDNDLVVWGNSLSVTDKIIEAGFGSVYNDGSGRRFWATHCMADSGNVVIGPDGSLFPCEHCPPQSRFGDIFHGVTDQAARDEFCRTDVVRDKCRKCPGLPLCTAFQTCPIQDKDCWEAQAMLEREYLKEMMDHRKENEEKDDDHTVIC